jgi:hypothetical protein
MGFISLSIETETLQGKQTSEVIPGTYFFTKLSVDHLKHSE